MFQWSSWIKGEWDGYVYRYGSCVTHEVSCGLFMEDEYAHFYLHFSANIKYDFQYFGK